MGSNRGMSVDDFLNDSGDRTRGGGSFHTWKKEGSTRVWLRAGGDWCFKVWNHPVPRVIEFKDKETGDKSMLARSDRWNCHEAEELLKKRYYREDNGERVIPPVICPQCIFNEVIFEMVQKGIIKWTDPILRWEGDGEEDNGGDIVIRAAGLYNGFNTDEVKQDRDALRELKKLGIRRDKAWNQSMLVRLQWLFLVATEDKLSDGLLKSFESMGLGNKMKKAIKDQMRLHREKGNPTINPYPFEWTYDESGSFEDKYDVLARFEDKPSAEVLAVLNGPAPDIEKDLEPGNCWWLKNELESHWIHTVKFPWERAFGPAEKAGLMVPPEDSKADADDEIEEDDEDDGVPEVGRGIETKVETLVVDSEHDVWFEGSKPDPKVKGKRVELEGPDDATPAEVDAATKLLLSWGATEVAVIASCDHCGGRMTNQDVDCPKCGALYDDDGGIVSRPCLANAKHQVKLEGDGPNYICGDCAAIHALAAETPDCYGAARWTLVSKPEEPKTNGKRRRLGAATEEEEKPEIAPLEAPRRRRGVPFDQKAAGK